MGNPCDVTEKGETLVDEPNKVTTDPGTSDAVKEVVLSMKITEGVPGNSEVVTIGGSIDVPNSPKFMAIGVSIEVVDSASDPVVKVIGGPK